jgi:lactam utilization protein B
MGKDATVIALTEQERMLLDMIVIDEDAGQALAFLRQLRSKIETSTIKGMKSHLDG